MNVYQYMYVIMNGMPEKGAGWGESGFVVKILR